MDLLNFNTKLNQIKIKNKCVYILKYYLIHAYDCELLFLLKTLGILKMKYRKYENFIDQNIQRMFTTSDGRHSELNLKITNIINSINLHDYYDLYEDIIYTLEC
jgi:hypothetical protein